MGNQPILVLGVNSLQEVRTRIIVCNEETEKGDVKSIVSVGICDVFFQGLPDVIAAAQWCNEIKDSRDKTSQGGETHANPV